MQRIAVLKNNGVTGAMVAFSWLGRQIQPLQKRCHAGFEYSGLDDPSRFSSEVIHTNEAMAILNDLFEGVDSVPELPKLYLRVVFWKLSCQFLFLVLVANCCFFL